MHVSLSELEITLVKAVTGLGLPLGFGEEAGRAARQAALDGWNAVAAFVAALEGLDRGAAGSFDGAAAGAGRFRSADPAIPLSALLAAPPACDLLLASGGAVTLEVVDCPAVVLAQIRCRRFASPLLAEGVAFVCGDGPALHCGAAGLLGPLDALAALSRAGPCAVTLAPGTADEAAASLLCAPNRALLEGVELDDELWRRLCGFYARTLVEASETSRISGAGAGLTDND